MTENSDIERPISRLTLLVAQMLGTALTASIPVALEIILFG